MREGVVGFGRAAISDQDIDFFDVDAGDADEAGGDCVASSLGFLLCFVRIWS